MPRIQIVLMSLNSFFSAVTNLLTEYHDNQDNE